MRQPSIQKNVPARAEVTPTSAFVYIIVAGALGPVKIGWASDPFQRLALLQTGNHQELNLLHFEDFQDRRLACTVESELHQTFLKQRIRGEWFRSDGPVREMIDQCAMGASLIDFTTTAYLVRANVAWVTREVSA